MRKIIFESFQDVELYLRSPELIDEIVKEFGTDFSQVDSRDISEFVVRKVKEVYDYDLNSEKVVICKVVDEEIDLIGQSHTVVVFNSNYYDYNAQSYNDSFNGMIRVGNLPVVQPVIHSDEQVNDKLSTVKGYVILGY